MSPESLPHRFIVIEGPIGVGKTTLATQLATSLGAELVLERADQNPFLERFYRNPRAGALPAQLYFLFSARSAARDAEAAGPVRPAAHRRLPDRQGSAVRARHAR